MWENDSEMEWDPPKESGYCTDFEDYMFFEMEAIRSTLLDNDVESDDGDDVDSALLTANLDEHANQLIDQPTLSNIFYAKIEHKTVRRLKKNLRTFLENQIDQENITDAFATETNSDGYRPPSIDLFESFSDDETKNISPDIFSDSDEDVQMLSEQNILEPIVLITEKSTEKQDLIVRVENLITKLLQDLTSGGNAKIMVVNCAKWENCEKSNGILSLKEPSSLIYRCVSLKSIKCRYHFAMIMYVLSEIYHLLITNTTCTERELYYQDPELAENQQNVKSAVKDICVVLNACPWELGICCSSKGLIAGSIRIHMSNHPVIDCYLYDGATLIPGDIQAISYLETTAKFVLIIEKDTMFEKLLKQNILLNLNSDIVIITGKGYPDLSTRLIVKKLRNDFHLPIYILVDADPFGIDIMLVYRFGSRAMALNSDDLACPEVRWIGIYPSEIDLLAIPSMPQSKEDKKKINELLQRSYLTAEIRNELGTLQELNRKAEIEGVAGFSAKFLVSDYIANKIKRNLVI